MELDRETLKEKLSALATAGVFIGTSSWKYPGWCSDIYESARYEWRGKFAQSRFNKNCLTEYGDVFKTVCVDAAYYTFPSAQYLEGLAFQTPEDFQFAFKVTDSITIKQFPNLPRFGDRAGKANEHFLNAELFSKAFLEPCKSIETQVGLLMFEFSRFYPMDYPKGRDFVADLDAFFEKLPKGWPYAIEIRNQNWLRSDYFECLARHGITHVFNSWEAMPSVAEQMAIPESFTTSNRVAARFLLKPGRKYATAVKAFEPYRAVKEVNEEGRKAGTELIRKGLGLGRKTFIFVNNRFEGNAPGTIRAILKAHDEARGREGEHS